MNNECPLYEREIFDDEDGSPDNSFHCANCDALFDMGNLYPQDTFCCSHCYYRYHGDECPAEHNCEMCADDDESWDDD